MLVWFLPVFLVLLLIGWGLTGLYQVDAEAYQKLQQSLNP